MGFKTGKMGSLTEAEFRALVRASTSTYDFCKRAQVSVGEGSLLGLCSRLTAYGVDVSHWRNDPRKGLAKNFLRVYSKSGRKSRPQGYKVAYDYVCPGQECTVCGQGPIWNGKPTPFEIDHINGDAWDCRISNLRRVCPNCHRQQDTSSAGWGIKFAEPTPELKSISRIPKDLRGRADSDLLEAFYNKELYNDFMKTTKRGTADSFRRHSHEGLRTLIRELQSELGCLNLREVSVEDLRRVTRLIKERNASAGSFTLYAIAILSMHEDLSSWRPVGSKRRPHIKLPAHAPLFAHLA